MLRNEELYKLDYDKNTYRAITSLTNTKIDVEKYITDCINDYELFRLDDNNKFFSNSLLKRMEEYDHKKAISRENGKKGGAPKGNQNAKKNKQETTQNNQQVDLEQAETTQNNQSKVKKSKVKESKENNNNILNKTKLNSLYLYIKNEEEKFEGLSDVDKSSIQTTLKRLGLFIENDIYLPEKMKFELKIKYYAVTQLYLSSYKIYIKDLTDEKLTFNYLQANKYCPIDNEENLEEFMNYYIVCLRKDLKNETIK